MGVVLPRLNDTMKERMRELWKMLSRPPSLNTREAPKRIPVRDATLLREAAIITDASHMPTQGWVTPFSVVEEKSTGIRRRWIAWPRNKNNEDPYEVQVPWRHISTYLPAVREECGACLDLKASFFQIALPMEAMPLFRCRVVDGSLIELTRLPMGYKASPEILQMVTGVIAGSQDVVSDDWAAPKAIRVDVWIDNIRISGTSNEVRPWYDIMLKNADACQTTIGEAVLCTTEYTFLGVDFDHMDQTVSLGNKITRSLNKSPRWESITIRALECVASRMLYAAAIVGVVLVHYYFFLKVVRRLLSALNGGLVMVEEAENFPPSAISAGETLLSRILDQPRRKMEEIVPASAALVTDASLSGWGAILIPDTGGFQIASGCWKTALKLIMQAEARGVGLALRAFRELLPASVNIWVDNTSLQGAALKGNTKSYALAKELQDIFKILDESQVQAAFQYIKSAENPADGLSRGRVFDVNDLAKGLRLAKGSGWSSFGVGRLFEPATS